MYAYISYIHTYPTYIHAYLANINYKKIASYKVFSSNQLGFIRVLPFYRYAYIRRYIITLHGLSPQVKFLADMNVAITESLK